MGIHGQQLRRWSEQGVVRQVSRGLYYLPDADLGDHRSLVEVCATVANAVICLLSALRFHGVGTQNPSAVWIALPKGQRPPRRSDLDLKVLRLLPGVHDRDVERRESPGGTIAVYSLERTLVDCFRFRDQVGLDVFLEAMRQALREHRVSLDRIQALAKLLRVAGPIRPYLEAI